MFKTLKEKLKRIIAKDKRALVVAIILILFSFVFLRSILMPQFASVVIGDNFIADDFSDNSMSEYTVYLSQSDGNPDVEYWLGSGNLYVGESRDQAILEGCGVATFVYSLEPAIRILGVSIDALILSSSGYGYLPALQDSPPTYGSVFFEFVLANGSSYLVWFYGNFTESGEEDIYADQGLYQNGYPATQDPPVIARIPFDVPGNIDMGGGWTGYHVNSGKIQLQGELIEIRIHVVVDDGFASEPGDQLGIGLNYYNITLSGAFFQVMITNPSEGETVNTSKVMIAWTYNDSLGLLDHFEVSIDFGSWLNVGLQTYYITEPLIDGSHIAIVRMYSTQGDFEEDNVSFIVDTVRVDAPDSVDPLAFNITLRFGIPLENQTFDIKLYYVGYEPTSTSDLDPQYAYWFRYYPNTSTFEVLGSGSIEFKERTVDAGEGVNYDVIEIHLEGIAWRGTWEIKIIPSVGATKTDTFNVNAFINVSLDRTAIYYSIVPTTNNTVVPIGYFTINITANTKFALYLRASGNATGVNTSWEIPIWYFYFDTDGTWDGNEKALNTTNILVDQILTAPYYNRTFTIYLYWRVLLPIPDDTYKFILYIIVEIL